MLWNAPRSFTVCQILALILPTTMTATGRGLVSGRFMRLKSLLGWRAAGSAPPPGGRLGREFGKDAFVAKVFQVHEFEHEAFVFVGDFEDAVHDVLLMLGVEAAARSWAAALRLLFAAVAGFDDLRVREVCRLGEGQEIVRVVAMRALP